jgi:hypothetical protein
MVHILLDVMIAAATRSACLTSFKLSPRENIRYHLGSLGPSILHKEGGGGLRDIRASSMAFAFVYVSSPSRLLLGDGQERTKRSE